MNSVFVSHPQNLLEHYFGAKAIDALKAIATVQFNPERRELSISELIDAAMHSDAIIAYRQTSAPRALFSALPNLAAFVRCAVDISTIDVAAASEQGILVTQASAGFVPAVSEWVIGAMLDLARATSSYAASYHRGVAPIPAMGRELRGAVLGIIGYGRISRYLCQLAQAFGMRVLVSDPYVAIEPGAVRQVELPALLHESDFVVCLAISNAETANMMDAKAFAAMKPGACFINTARGELVDEAALLAALESGHLAGCALDVGRARDQMPSLSLASHPRVIATPHVGGLTPGAIEHQALETVSQVKTLFQGEIPVGAVNAGHARRLGKWRCDSLAGAPGAAC
ncbi:hydroxyacid dehydrogenase [Paralcaligenes sp. KSB-10]|uniref:hydroxyacid dehydrogenase n=1 Tax=Paralcaligenes sp. KSB-10 TaxID=2901142 RepID=UPI001E40CA97|nr:hydroxyacid dehydrogenase [Paralcaligenes sp. KSB-10]UHL63184.1 hydroxyacid dehydrogenase [Paralcaligenes sp. KSB-10]